MCSSDLESLHLGGTFHDFDREQLLFLLLLGCVILSLDVFLEDFFLLYFRPLLQSHT